MLLLITNVGESMRFREYFLWNLFLRAIFVWFKMLSFYVSNLFWYFLYVVYWVLFNAIIFNKKYRKYTLSFNKYMRNVFVANRINIIYHLAKLFLMVWRTICKLFSIAKILNANEWIYLNVIHLHKYEVRTHR